MQHYFIGLLRGNDEIAEGTSLIFFNKEKFYIHIYQEKFDIHQGPGEQGWIQRCIKLISCPSSGGNEHSGSFYPAAWKIKREQKSLLYLLSIFT